MVKITNVWRIAAWSCVGPKSRNMVGLMLRETSGEKQFIGVKSATPSRRAWFLNRGVSLLSGIARWDDPGFSGHISPDLGLCTPF